MANEKASFSADEVIDLRDLVAAVWWSKWIVIALAAAGVVYGLYNLQKLQPTYTAELVLAPENAMQMGGGDAGVGRLAEAFGIGGGGNSNPTIDRLKLLLGTSEFAHRLQEKHNFIKFVYKGSWNPEAKTWIQPEGLRFRLQQKIDSFLKRPLWSAPNLNSLSEMISHAIVIEQIEGTAFMAMRFSHSDPKYALKFLSIVYHEADSLLREQDREQSVQRKQYLEGQLIKVSLKESRNIVLSLLMQEENSLMLLNSGITYAGRLLVKPKVSFQPDVPSLMKLLVVPALGLALMGLIGAVLFWFYKRGA